MKEDSRMTIVAMRKLASEAVKAIESEVFINELGQGFASIRAVARLAGVNDSSLVRQFRGAVLSASLLAEMLAEEGFDAAALAEFSSLGVPDIAIGVILDYFANEAGRHCTAQAKAVYRVFSKIGIRLWMQKETGWQKPIEQSPPINLNPNAVRNAVRFSDEQIRAYRLVADDPELAEAILNTFAGDAADTLIAPTLPDPKLAKTLNDSFLNLNRLGLAMNKVLKANETLTKAKPIAKPAPAISIDARTYLQNPGMVPDFPTKNLKLRDVFDFAQDDLMGDILVEDVI